MTPDQFVVLAQACIAKQPELFGELEPFNGADPALPAAFRFVIERFGTGWFGDVLITQPVRIVIPSGVTFVACTDDEAGGHYGFLSHDGAIGPEVLYWYPSEEDPPARSHDDFFDLVVDLGLSRLLALP